MPNLFISGEALAMSEERLRQLGIGAIVACGCKSHFPAKFLYHEVHVQDNANAKIGHLLRPAANFIAKALAAGKPVLVHCKAGICRSASVIIAYLLMHRRDLVGSVDDALALIKAARPCAFPREEFLAACERLNAEVKHIKPVAARSPRKKRHPWASSPETSDESDDEPAEAESEHDATGGVSVEGDACPTPWTHVFEGEYDDDGVYFYQAFNDAIADWAVEHQALGGPAFNATRMTWIKPSFAWVLYRSGYAASTAGAVLKLKLPHAAVAALLSRCACKVGGGGGGARAVTARDRDERGRGKAPSRGSARARDPDRLGASLGDVRGEHHRVHDVTVSRVAGAAHNAKDVKAAMAEFAAPPRERTYLPRLPPRAPARLGMSGAVMEALAGRCRRCARIPSGLRSLRSTAVAEGPARGEQRRAGHDGRMRARRTKRWNSCRDRAPCSRSRFCDGQRCSPPSS